MEQIFQNGDGNKYFPEQILHLALYLQYEMPP